MSSDYLNYELSKELHDLGVVFNTDWVITEHGEVCPTSAKYEDYIDTKNNERCGPGRSEGYGMPLNEKYVRTPNAAQLMDKLTNIARERRGHFSINIDQHGFYINFGSFSEYERIAKDQCATTALGKALIALVKKDKKCQK